MENGIPQAWWEAGPVLQLSLPLRGDLPRPADGERQGGGLAEISLCSLLSLREQGAWLELMNVAFPRRRRPWASLDFQAELARRRWWSPMQTQIVFGMFPGDWPPRTLLMESSQASAPRRADDRDPLQQPLGTVTLELDRAAMTARIHWLAVHPQARQRGVGRTLVQWAAQTAHAEGAQILQAETLRAWTTTLHFYYQLGFQLHGEAHDAENAHQADSPT